MIYIYIYIVTSSILMMYTHSSRDTGRGVVEVCWSETSGVKRMRPILPSWHELECVVE